MWLRTAALAFMRGCAATACAYVLLTCGAWCANAGARGVGATRVAGIRFSPATGGFAFPNYGNTAGIMNLTPVQMQQLFGPVVCTSGTGASCLLSPPALQWMTEQNQLMASGHCEGLAISALLFARRTLNPAAYGGRVPTLKLGGNATLQGLIAYTYAFGALPSVQQAAVTEEAPIAVVQRLVAALRAGQQQWVLHLFKPDMSGGHAVTPYEVDSLGHGRYGIRIYDNNWPRLVRTITVDSRSNSWSYQATQNPRDKSELYSGNASTHTLQLWNLAPGLGVQPCPFCAAVDDSATLEPEQVGKRLEVALTSSGGTASRARIFVRGASGRIGYPGRGPFVRKFKGARVRWLTNAGSQSWRAPAVPVLDLPATGTYAISLTGQGRAAASQALSMIGPGFSSAVEGLALTGRDAAAVTTSATGALTFQPVAGAAQSPRLMLGIDGQGSDYTLTVTPEGLGRGQSLGLAANPAIGTLTIAPPRQGQVQLSTQVDRANPDGSVDVFASGPVIQVAAAHGPTVVDYGAWAGGSAPLIIQQGSGAPQQIANHPGLAVEQDPNGGFGTVPAGGSGGSAGTGPDPSPVAPAPTVTPPASAVAPAVSGANPGACAAGGFGCVITISGTGFEPGAQVTFSNPGIVVTETRFDTASQLTATIRVAPGATPGVGDVTVTNPDGTAATGSQIFTVGPVPQLSFAAARTVALGYRPRLPAVGDLNGDGKPDLAVALGTAGTVSVLLGNGDGTFQTPHTYAVGAAPQSVAIEDLDGDHKPDLAVPNFSDATVSVLLGNGDGSFAAQVPYTAGSEPRSVAVGDLNGDGKPDLAVANSGANTVSVLLGSGDGMFQPQHTYAVGTTPQSVTAADFDGDGKLDLAVANNSSSGVSVLRGNGDGTLQTQHTYATGSAPVAVVVADLDGDHQPDLVTANESDNTVSILLNTTRTS